MEKFFQNNSNVFSFNFGFRKRGDLYTRALGIILFIYLLVFAMGCSAQKNSASNDTTAFQLIKKIDADARFIASDKLQQLYIVTSKNDIRKYNPEGKELFLFSNNTLGELTHLDATNPFSVLLYYPDFMTVYTLDRTLNKTGEFNLFDLNLMEVEAIAMSNDNNVWLYDDVANKVKKVNRNGEVLRESQNLGNLFKTLLHPNFMLERENWLYINDPNLGVLVFDIYGQYAKLLEIKNLDQFQVMDKRLIYKEKENLMSFQLQSLSTIKITLPPGITAEDQVIIQKNKLFVRKGKQVEIYSF